MTLQEQGFRFFVSANKALYGWVHPAESAERVAAGWVDCTDMTGDEFDVYMGDALEPMEVEESEDA